MILEQAILEVKPKQVKDFEADFEQAQKYIMAIDGYITHSLHRSLEIKNKYLLLVSWKDLESHTINFRTSQGYQEWKKLLHSYYDPFPSIAHYQQIF